MLYVSRFVWGGGRCLVPALGSHVAPAGLARVTRLGTKGPKKVPPSRSPYPSALHHGAETQVVVKNVENLDIAISMQSYAIHKRQANLVIWQCQTRPSSPTTSSASTSSGLAT